MFPEFKKYSILPESKGTITSFNTIPMSQELVDENNYPLFEGVINLAKEKQQQPMKTAMQELIEKLNNVKPTEFCSIDTIREWSKELLEKEKEQIINAWIATDNELQRMKAEEYYNQTYNK